MALMFCTKLYAVDDNLIISKTFPEKLSDFSFFKDSSAQIPHDEVIPYELISTLFSDYSYKQRWVYVPKNKKAKYEEDWDAEAIEGRAKKLADECYLNVFGIGEALNFPKIPDNYLEKFK